MSTRAKIAAAAAGIGVLALGWNIGTADSQTVLPTPTTTPTTTQTSTATTQPSTSNRTLADGTYTGTTVSHRYGSVQVSVTITNGAISALTPTVVSDGDRHSERINQAAVPVLESEITQANSAQVSTVSGATYTTTAYLQSLQSALDQAR